MVAAAKVLLMFTVNAGPTANATSNSPVCVGGDINLSLQVPVPVQLIPGPPEWI
jgi:hypothetical protein